MKDLIRKCLIGAVAAAFVLAAPQVATADEGKAFANGSFKIIVPAGFGEFAAQTQKTKGENGVTETTNYIAKAETGEAIVVTVSKMPGTILDPEKMIDSTRDSLFKSLNAVVESEEKLEGNRSETAIHFRSGGESPAYLRSKLLVDDDRFYQVLYVGRSKEQRTAPAIATLFDSFDIIAPTASQSTVAD